LVAIEPGENRAMKVTRGFYAAIGFLTVTIGRRVLARKIRAGLHRS